MELKFYHFLILYLIYLFVFCGFSAFVLYRMLELSFESDRTRFASAIYIAIVGIIILFSAIMIIQMRPWSTSIFGG
jgi:uncharacterized membrane protein